MHSQVICICIHVAAATEEIVYEVVAEPPELLEQAQQEERRENQAQGPVDPSACPIILNYDIYIRFYYLCITFQELNWNPSCMIPRFP